MYLMYQYICVCICAYVYMTYKDFETLCVVAKSP